MHLFTPPGFRELVLRDQAGWEAALAELVAQGVPMASLSDFAENAIADAICNNVPFSVATPYVKLHTGDPGENGTANAASETTRKLASFAAASGGVCVTDADLYWTAVAASETYSHISVWDASTGGNCIGSGALAVAKVMTAGDDFKMAAGQGSVTIQ